MLKTVSELSIPKEHPERKILLTALRQYIDGEFMDGKLLKITEEEFNDIIYRWTIIYALNDFHRAPIPLTPKGYDEYMNLPRKRRRKVIVEDEAIRTMVISHRGRVIVTEYKNKDNQRWLSRMREYFKDRNEMEKVKQIEEVEETYL